MTAPAAPVPPTDRSARPALAFAALYAAQFGFLGVQLPFFARWLDGRGFDAAQIGVLGGLALGLRLLLAPPLAYRAESAADPRGPQRTVTAVICALGAALLLPLPREGIALVVIALLFLFGLAIPLADASVLRADRAGQLTYGRTRSAGSIGFIAANLAGGAVIGRFGEGSIVWMMAGLGALMLAASLAVPPAPSAGPAPRPSLGEAGRLLRSKSFVLMVFAAGFCQASHAVYYTFTALHWEALGYSDPLIGALWTVGILVEIVMLVYGRAVSRRVDPALLIAIGCATAIVRWPLTGLNPPLWALFLIQLGHAGTFTAGFLGSVEFVGRAVPDRYRATAMTVVSTLGVGALTGLATTLAGLVFVAEAPWLAYAGMGGMGAAGLVLALLLRARWDGGPLRAVRAPAARRATKAPWGSPRAPRPGAARTARRKRRARRAGRAGAGAGRSRRTGRPRARRGEARAACRRAGGTTWTP